jgi:hypothetical protein
MNLAFRMAAEGGDDKPRLPGSLHVNRRLDRWLSIHADCHVAIRPGKVELGQGILTALAQISADELDVALSRIRVQPASTPDSPDEAVTSGSLSVQECGTALRHACADARRIFLSVVAQRSGVGVDDIAVRDGAFLAPDGRVLGSSWAKHHAEAAAERLAPRATWDAEDTLPPDHAVEGWPRAAPRESSIVTETTAETPAPAHRVQAAFFRSFLAHASICPSCAVTRRDGTTMEVRSHSQGIYTLRADQVKALRLPPERIVVHHVEGSGCYGHNGADDVALNAALVARAHQGRPVRVQWSRAEELGWSPFSPGMLVEIEAEAAQDGTVLRWQQEAVSNGHSSRPGRGRDPTLLSAAYLAEPFPVPLAINPPALAGGGIQRNAVPPYRAPALKVGIHRVMEMPIRASAARPRRAGECLGDRERDGRTRRAGRRGSAAASPAPPGRRTLPRRAVARRRWPAGRRARRRRAWASASACRATRAPAPGARRWRRLSARSACAARACGFPAMWARSSTPTASRTRWKAARSRPSPCA